MSRDGGLFRAHVPGTSALHRAPFAPKALGVLAVGAAAYRLPDWRAAATLLALLVGVHVASGLGLRRLVTSLRPLAAVLVVLGAVQWWSHDLAEAARVVLGLASCFLAAGLLTATTPVDRMLDAVATGARPLRRWVDPEVVALTVGILLRSVPWVAGAFHDVRDAARARGLERSPRAVVLPFVIHVVAYGRATGDALAARGLGDPDEH
ncbi:MAG TPA: energy-coupling factor transporter transmembrane protein EcfT [Intrasporangium sp.]|uniref:energy-coupling factor transporter transmembrane component T family protein n=1 Tax=Intrasporangium sp. TaxID=1925024 RepID=UPI002D76D63B|nr:energy-coupling factor transporter transmembrane protein EcfT [Intrasporangium sp.]HET7398335.1 energy-coupling factor transporter transmembrane protein EcfT [Intrasporangium sp.]